MTIEGRDRLLKLDEVKDRVGLGKTMIYRMIGQATFPAPYKPGGAASRWSELEIDAWIEATKGNRQ